MKGIIGAYDEYLLMEERNKPTMAEKFYSIEKFKKDRREREIIQEAVWKFFHEPMSQTYIHLSLETISYPLCYQWVPEDLKETIELTDDATKATCETCLFIKEALDNETAHIPKSGS